MDKIVIWSTLVASLFTTAAFAADLTVTVAGLKEQRGLLNVSVFDSEEAWVDGRKIAASKQVEVHAETEMVVFDDLAPGVYSIQLTHDENGKLDTNLFGVPKEGWGFSNNPRVVGRARWDQSVFELGKEDLMITIYIR